MEFWGVEVKSGVPCTVKPGVGRIVHVSQACLGAFKKDKGSESVYLNVTVGGKKLVLGTLSLEKFPQLQFDLVFDKNFELSHNWKNGSVYFYGYRCDNPFNDTDDDAEGDSDDLPVTAADYEIGKNKPEAKQEKSPAVENSSTAKLESAVEKQKMKIVESKKGVKIFEEGGSEEGFGSDSSGSDDSDSEEDDESEPESAADDSDDEDEAPKKAEPTKKRPAESAKKGPIPDKKAKLVTPQKTGADAKKVIVHVATPHPAKQTGKTPANQPKQQALKSGGSHPCKLCNRSFNSENALQSHSKAKHSAGK